MTRSGWAWPYASASVVPQEPPATSHLSMPRWVRSSSRSVIIAWVVRVDRSKPGSVAKGRLRPQARWSRPTISHRFGSGALL